MPKPSIGELNQKYKILTERKGSFNPSEAQNKLMSQFDAYVARTGGELSEIVSIIEVPEKKVSLYRNPAKGDDPESKKNYEKKRDQARLEALKRNIEAYKLSLERYIGKYNGDVDNGIDVGSKVDIDNIKKKYGANLNEEIKVKFIDGVGTDDLISYIEKKQRKNLESIAKKCANLRANINDKSLLNDELNKDLLKELEEYQFERKRYSKAVEESARKIYHEKLLKRLHGNYSRLPHSIKLSQRANAFIESDKDFNKEILGTDDLSRLGEKSTVEILKLLGSYQDSGISIFNFTEEKRDLLKEKVRQRMTQFNVGYAAHIEEMNKGYTPKNFFGNYKDVPVTDTEVNECIAYYQKQQEYRVNFILSMLRSRGIALANAPMNIDSFYGRDGVWDIPKEFQGFDNDYGIYNGEEKNKLGTVFSDKLAQVKDDLDKLAASNEVLKQLLDNVYPSSEEVKKQNENVDDVETQQENIRKAYDGALETFEKKKTEYLANIPPEKRQVYLEAARKAVDNPDLNPGGKYTAEDLIRYIEGVQCSSLNQYRHLKNITVESSKEDDFPQPEIYVKDLIASLARRQLAPAAITELQSEEVLDKAKKYDDKIAKEKADKEKAAKEQEEKLKAERAERARKLHEEQSRVAHSLSYRQFVAKPDGFANPNPSFSPYDMFELYNAVEGKKDEFFKLSHGDYGKIDSQAIEKFLNPKSSMIFMSDEELTEFAKPISEILSQKNLARQKAGKPLLGDPDILAKEYLKDLGYHQKREMEYMLKKNQVSQELINKNKEDAIKELEDAINKSDLFKKALENSTPLYRADIERQVRLKKGIDPDKVEIVPKGDPREKGYFAYSPANLVDMIVPGIDKNTYVTYAKEEDYEAGFHENERRYEDYKKRYLLNLSEDQRKQYKEEAERLMKDNPKLNADDLMRYIETKQEQSIFNYNHLLTDIRAYGMYHYSEEEAKWFSSMKHPAISGVDNFKDIIGIKYGAPELVREIRKYEKEHGIVPEGEEKVEIPQEQPKEDPQVVEEVKKEPQINPNPKVEPQKAEKVEVFNAEPDIDIKPQHHLDLDDEIIPNQEPIANQEPQIIPNPKVEPQKAEKVEVFNAEPDVDIKPQHHLDPDDEIIPNQEPIANQEPPKEEIKIEIPNEEPAFISHEKYAVPTTADVENEIIPLIKSRAGQKYELIGSLINYNVAKAKEALNKFAALSPIEKNGGKGIKLVEEAEQFKRHNETMYSEFNKHRINSLNEEQKIRLDNELEEASKEFGITKEDMFGIVRTIHKEISNGFKYQLDSNYDIDSYTYDGYFHALDKMGESILSKKMLENPSIKDAELEVDPDFVETCELFLADEAMQDFLGKELNGKKISDLSWKEYSNLERGALAIMQDWDRKNGEDQLSDITDTRELLKYYSLKKDNLLKFEYNENAEITSAEFDYTADTIDINAKDKAYNELESLVTESALLQSYLNNAEPMAKQDVLIENIKAFQSNEKTLQEKVSNFYDNLPDDKKLELQNEAEKITNGHAYLNSADVMKYFIHKQYDTILKYRATVDPKKLDDKFDNYTFAPTTMKALKRNIGERYAKLELAKKKPEIKEEAPQNPLANEEPPKEEIKVEIPKEEPKVVENPKEEIHEIPMQENPREEINEIPMREQPRPVIKPLPKAENKPARRITDQDVSPFAKELIRLDQRLKVTQDDEKQKNSDSYRILKTTFSKYDSDAPDIGNVENLRGALDELDEKANAYMIEHSMKKPGLFTTCGKARKERIKACARIKVMNALLRSGYAYDSKEGKKAMLACKLVCAEALENGFKGFRLLCQNGVIMNAVKNKLKDINFNLIANRALQNPEDYDKIIKKRGDKCLSSFNKLVSALEKAAKANKNPQANNQEIKQDDFVNLL